MTVWLAAAGVDYLWFESLGGRRTPRPDSPNTGLRNEQFRGYADHMASSEFRRAVDELKRAATARRVAVMCAESIWWRCHRRLLADHLVLVEQLKVEHLLHDCRTTAHEPTPEAQAEGRTVVYTDGAPTLFNDVNRSP